MSKLGTLALADVDRAAIADAVAVLRAASRCFPMTGEEARHRTVETEVWLLPLTDSAP